MIVVTGGGPAGRMAAVRLALAKREVTLVDHRKEGLGGQCLFHGCMVMNAYNDLAREISRMRELASLGIIDTVPVVSYEALVSRLQEIQGIITHVLDTETRQAGVHVCQGSASITGNRVFIDGNEIIAEAIIIANGSVPSLPDDYQTDIPGVYTPHTILNHKKLPEKLTIIGSGIIAAEYAYAFYALGASVDIIARSSLLRSIPQNQCDEMRKDLDGITIHEETHVIGIEGRESVTGVRIIKNNKQEVIPSDCVLLATGLVPETSMITGIPLDSNGAIIVDETMQTKIPGVYAVGDVTGPPFLTPVARRQGIIAADAIIGRKPGKMPVVIPQVIRLRHEHGFVSTPSEKERAAGIPSPAGPGTFWSVPFRNTGKAFMEVDGDNRICRIYEASPCAGTVAAYYAQLMNKGVTPEEIADGIEVHPSADGLAWIARYLTETRENELNR
ncbi:MAG: NAD(P)/FAD-dependent oxidoreductase [Methanospirillaceae archaeon]|nr:NAD(P)/FAD-dependent oxidoreductase [Methanospirillaceae archaeon]